MFLFESVCKRSLVFFYFSLKEVIPLTETFYNLSGAPRLAVLGDFHNGDPLPILRSLEKQKPDIIAIPGDLVYGSPPDHGLMTKEQKNVLPLLRGAMGIAPVFFSPGNHESILCPEDWDAISSCGVQILDNRWVRHGNIWLGGLTSHYVLNHRAYMLSHPSCERYIRRRYSDESWVPIREPDLSWLEPLPEGYTVLLCHHPEYYPLLPRLNLIVSAHAHGGQIRLFGRGLFAPGQGWFPKYTCGIHDGRFIISRGLTNTTWVPRLFNPPEIVYIFPES